MITFGGRPLNTYKGGEMEWRTKSTQPVGQYIQPTTQSTQEENPRGNYRNGQFTPTSATPKGQSTTSVTPPAKSTTSVTPPAQPTPQEENPWRNYRNGMYTDEPTPTSVTSEGQSVTPPSQSITSQSMKSESEPTNTTKPAPTAQSLTPVVVEVNSNSVTIDGPGLFDPPTKNTNEDTNRGIDDQLNEALNMHGGKAGILKLKKEMEKAAFNNRLVVKIFGKEIVLTVEFLIWVAGILWSLIIFAIIFSICYFLYEITQGVLNAYHTVVDGITKLMEDINNVAIKFEVPGINKKIGPFNISMPPLLKVNFKLFGGMFDGPLRDMYRAGNFTRSAAELIIEILIKMIIGIVESLPAIGEGIMNALEKIGDAI